VLINDYGFLTLPLFVLFSAAYHAHNIFAANDFALFTNFLY